MALSARAQSIRDEASALVERVATNAQGIAMVARCSEQLANGHTWWASHSIYDLAAGTYAAAERLLDNVSAFCARTSDRMAVQGSAQPIDEQSRKAVRACVVQTIEALDLLETSGVGPGDFLPSLIDGFRTVFGGAFSIVLAPFAPGGSLNEVTKWLALGVGGLALIWVVSMYGKGKL